MAMTDVSAWRKYPRTPHHPASPGIASDDKVASDLTRLEGAEVIITEKMDGENTTLYQDGFHARSMDSGYHPSRSWLAGFHASVCHAIPEGWRVCGENLFARHAVGYSNLPSYFLAFSVWDGERCLSWVETELWLAECKIEAVPVLYRGVFSSAALVRVVAQLDTARQEGFVVRNAGSFLADDFSTNVVKWVRAGHVQTDQHWSKAPIVRNNLKEDRPA
jgi:hypothetical protein